MPFPIGLLLELLLLMLVLVYSIEVTKKEHVSKQMMLPTKTILIIGVLIKNKSSKPINIIRSVGKLRLKMTRPCVSMISIHGINSVTIRCPFVTTNLDSQCGCLTSRSRQRDQQLSFNQIALDSAIRQQNAAKEEAMLGFAFDDLQLNMDIRNELSGTYRSLNAEAAKQRGYRSQAAFESERNMIAGLESEGAARASGRAGRSAAKEVQATIAKNAMQEAAIAEGVTQAGFQYALSVTEIVANLNQAYDQYYLDRQAIAASRNSYEKADMVAREQINQDFQQANMNAIAAVMLEPQKQPPLPEVIMAPATKFVKPQKLSQPDHLKRGDFGGNRNSGNSGLQAATDFLSDAGPAIGQWIANL